MRQLKKTFLFGAAAGLVLSAGAPLSGTALAQEAAVKEAPAKTKLPKAREVLDHYLEAIGGRDAVTGFSSSHATGTFSVPSQGMEGSFNIYSADPEYGYMEIQIPGMGQISMGNVDGVTWSKDPMTGPMILEGEQADQFRDQADQRRALYLPENYKRMEVVDQVEFNGTECYKVELVRKSDTLTTEYFDVKTGLMVGTELEQVTPMGKVPVVSTMADYQQHGGILLPTKLSQKMMGMEQIMIIDSMTFDDVDMSVFELSPEIKALAEAKKKEKD